MTALPPLRRLWTPKLMNINGPTSCHPQGITLARSLRWSSAGTMPPLCDGCNLSAALETPRLCSERGCWSNNMMAITFVLTRMFLHLVCYTECVCVCALCSGNIFTAIGLRKQSFDGKSPQKKEPRKRRAEKVNSCYDRLGKLCGFRLRVGFLRSLEATRTNKELLCGTVHRRCKIL